MDAWFRESHPAPRHGGLGPPGHPFGAGRRAGGRGRCAGPGGPPCRAERSRGPAAPTHRTADTHHHLNPL